MEEEQVDNKYTLMGCEIKDNTNTLNSIYLKSCEYADKYIRQKKYGYECESNFIEKCKKLNSYLNILEKENIKSLLGSKGCLSCESLQSLIEKVIGITGKNCEGGFTTIDIDESEKDQWVLDNFKCVSYEDWEKASYKYCDDLELKLYIEPEEVCKLTLDIKSNVIKADIFLAAKAFGNVKKYNLKLNRTEEECKLDFKLLHSKVKCDIDLKTYIDLIECNLSFDIIRTVYENNLELKVKTIKNKKDVYLKTALVEIPFDTLYTSVENIERKVGETKQTLENLLSDYK